MSEIGNVVALRTIVANVMSDLGVQADAGNTMRYYQWGIRGMRKISTFFGSWVETKKLTITEMNTVILPDDFVSLIRIGVPYNGKLWVSTKEPNLLIPTDIDCGEDVRNDDDGENIVIGANTLSHFMNTGGQNQEYYRLDIQNNRIILNGADRTDVIIEYKSNGINLDGDTRIPRMAEEALIAFIHWQRAVFDRDASRSQLADAKYRWIEEVRYLKAAQEPSIDALYDAVARGYKYGPKR